MLSLFLKGLMIGFAIAAPIGPIGVLCIQRTLDDGFKIGLMTGLGAALADGVYGVSTAFGLTSASSLLINYQYGLRVMGGIYLIYLGMKLLIKFKYQSLINNHLLNRSAWHACKTTFFLTLMNPATILLFIAVLTSLGFDSFHTDYINASLLVIGIILGSASWWLLLSGSIAYILRQRISSKTMRTINWLSGAIILTFGIIAICWH